MREIEAAIKKYERQQIAERSEPHERTYIQQGGGLSNTRHSDTGLPPTEQIRHDEEIVSQGSPPGTVQPVTAVREAIHPLPGDRGHSERTAGTDDGTAAGAEPTAKQGGQPDGLGGAHEQPEGPGRGSDLQRTDLRLEQETTETLEETPSGQGGVSASPGVISDEDIDRYLTEGSVTQDSKYRIFSFFLHDHNTREKADFLKGEYGYGGQTYYFADGERGYVQSVPSSGIEIAKGGFSDPTAGVKLSWATAAKRIDRLINENSYMSEAELNRLPSYERQILGADILYFFSGLPMDTPRPQVIKDSSADFWDDARNIGNSLDNPETVSSILEAMRPIMEDTPASDRYYDTRRRAFDSLTAFENGTFTLFPNMFPMPSFPTEREQAETILQSEEAEIAAQPPVITQDDIDDALRGWNGDADSIRRVYDFMGINGRGREAAVFLQNEYGKPEFIISKDGAEPQTLPWHKVQRRIAQLIAENNYIVGEKETIIEPVLENAAETLVVPEPEPALDDDQPKRPAASQLSLFIHEDYRISIVIA